MALVNKLEQAHEKVIFSSRGVNIAEKKLKSKGKSYSQKDIKEIVQAIDMNVNATKVNGRYLDSYYEPVGDDANNYIIAFHSGASLRRLEDLAKTDQKFQFYLFNLPEAIQKYLGIQFYPVRAIEKYLSDDVKEEIERIKRYLRDGILTYDNSGKIIPGPNYNFQSKKISHKTVTKAMNLYRYYNKGLYKFFIKPEYYNKYLGFVYSPFDRDIKEWFVANERKSYVGKENKGFLLEFGLKIASKSYLMTIDGKPIIKIDSLWELFPEAKQLFEEEKQVVKFKEIVSPKLNKLFGLDENVVEIEKMPASYVLVLKTNMDVVVGRGGSFNLLPKELKLFTTWDIAKIKGYKQILDAVDVYHQLKDKNETKITPNVLEKLKTNKEVKRMLFIYEKIKYSLEKDKEKVRKWKEKFTKIEKKLRDKVAKRVDDFNILKDIVKKLDNDIFKLLVVDILTDMFGEINKIEIGKKILEQIFKKSYDEITELETLRLLYIAEIFLTNIEAYKELPEFKMLEQNKKDRDELISLYQDYAQIKEKVKEAIKKDNLALLGLLEAVL